MKIKETNFNFGPRLIFYDQHYSTHVWNDVIGLPELNGRKATCVVTNVDYATHDIEHFYKLGCTVIAVSIGSIDNLRDSSELHELLFSETMKTMTDLGVTIIIFVSLSDDHSINWHSNTEWMDIIDKVPIYFYYSVSGNNFAGNVLLELEANEKLPFTLD